MRAGAVVNCDRLGKYRMPFAWTAYHLIDIISGACTVDASSISQQEKESQGSAMSRKVITFDSYGRVSQAVVSKV